MIEVQSQGTYKEVWDMFPADLMVANAPQWLDEQPVNGELVAKLLELKNNKEIAMLIQMFTRTNPNMTVGQSQSTGGLKSIRAQALGKLISEIESRNEALRRKEETEAAAAAALSPEEIRDQKIQKAIDAIDRSASDLANQMSQMRENANFFTEALASHIEGSLQADQPELTQSNHIAAHSFNEAAHYINILSQITILRDLNAEYTLDPQVSLLMDNFVQAFRNGVSKAINTAVSNGAIAADVSIHLRKSFMQFNRPEWYLTFDFNF